MADPTDRLVVPPGSYYLTKTVTPIQLDGLPIDKISGAQGSGRSTPGQQIADDQRFWASPPRPLADPYDEVIRLTLSKPKTINYISLDLPHFPHHFYIHWYDEKAKKWVPIRHTDGYDIRIYITGNVPQVIGPANVLQAHQHPSHYGADHWIHYDINCVPFTASKLHLSGTRVFGSSTGGPVDVHGKPAPYSLGMRNLDFGHRVLKKQDIPLTNRDPDIITERESFTVVTDILGSPVELSIRENRASDLVLGRMWKCEPQPFSYAVIPLYVDTRDSEGAPQVIDRFYLDPLTSGVRCNLYYSEATPDPTDFEAEDTPLAFPLTRQAGEISPAIDPDGLAFPDRISYVEVDNRAMQWDPAKPFWVGVELQPQFSSGTVDDHVIWDAGPFSLIWRDQLWALEFDNGLFTMPPFEFNFNDRLQFVIGYDGEQVFFYTPQGGAVLTPAKIEGLTVKTLRFGAEAGFTDEDLIITGAFRLISFVLKKESLAFAPGTVPDSGWFTPPESVQSFLADPASYVRQPPYAADDTGSTKNSLLRFSLGFVMGSPENGVNPWGFVGGPGDVYDDVVWTPVNRDFALHKGFMQFNPTRAAVFKFEFTNLQPQPYDVYQPTTTKVQVFPSAIVASSTPTLPSGPSGAGSPGLIANNDAVHPLTYADSARLRYAQPSPAASQDVSPTEALYATDPATAERLSGFGSLYNFHSWQPSANVPRFNQTAQHYYETVDVTKRSRVAYFVALAGLKAYRIDYATDDDTEMYLETFGDLRHIDEDSMTPQRVTETINHAVNPSFELDTDADGMPDSYSLTSQGTVTGTAAQSSDTSLYGVQSLKINATAMGSAGTDRLGVNVTPLGSPDALISEDFSVPSTNGWASAPTGQVWANSGGANSDFSKTGGVGRVALTSINVRRFTTISSNLADFNATGKFTVSATATGSSIVAAFVFRYQDDNNFYLCQFLHDTAGTVDIEITKRVAGTFTVITSGSNVIAYTPGTKLSFRVFATGTNFGMRIWAGSTEPSVWNLLATDTAFTRGKAGTHSNLVTGNTNTLPINVDYDDLVITNTEVVGLNMANSLVASVYAKVTHGTPIIRLTVEYYNSSNVFISSANTFQSGIGTDWTRIIGTFTPPVGADHVKVYAWAEAGNGAITAYLDGLQIEEGQVSDYCDGSRPGCLWTGATDNSVSKRPGADVSPWKWMPGALSTPADLSGPVSARSVIMPSRRKVRGIQYAAQQSSAVQLLIDPDFDDALLRAWTGLGDVAPLELSTEFSASIGSTVKVARLAGIDDWDAMEAAWSFWDALEESMEGPRPFWNDVEIDDIDGNVGGLRYTADVETTKAGRLYAAARVYTDASLADPLTLQLVDESGTVLAEADRVVKGGHVTEWFVGYTIGEGGAQVITTWNGIENSDPSASLPSYNDLEIQTWDSVDTTTMPLGTKVSVQLLQRGSASDTWYVDNLSLFEDAIVWEFSNDGGANWWPVYDIRNDPHGVFIFPDPTTPSAATGTQLMWRASGYRPYLHINSLAIRPWYGSLPLGVPHREPGMGGPNINPTDHYPPVEQDPRWQAWSEPIPQDWWFVQRQLLLLGRPYLPVDTSTPSEAADVWLNPLALGPVPPPPPSDTPPPVEPPAGPEIHVDIYSDLYPETYGPAAGSDTYTDSFGNGTY